MEWKEKVELIEVAIKQLIEENRKTAGISSLDDSSIAVIGDGDADRDDNLLAKLLSQLESLKAEGKLQQPDPSTGPTESLSPAAGNVDTETKEVGISDKGGSVIAEQNIVKELRKLKKQNFITHCLLSAMIVLTVVWQFSEVTLILKVKDRVSHPFRSVGNVIGGILKGQNKNKSGQDGEAEQSSTIPNLIESSSSYPGLKIPDLPKVEFPDFSSNGNRN